MKWPLTFLGAAVALLAIGAPAQAAKPSCLRGGARMITSTGAVNVVYIAPPEGKHGDVPEQTAYGCWVATGKRFKLFSAYFDDENDGWDIIDNRYIGVFRGIAGGVSSSSLANTWDARRARPLHDTKPCNTVQSDPSDDESGEGPDYAVFLSGGGIAYSCLGASHIADGHGDRLFEPSGTEATDLAVTPNNTRLFYMVGDIAKTIDIA